MTRLFRIVDMFGTGPFTANPLAVASARHHPVPGRPNASAGQWLFASGRASGGYVAAQGTRPGRTGRIHVMQDGAGQLWVGGATRTLFAGRTGA